MTETLSNGAPAPEQNRMVYTKGGNACLQKKNMS